MTFARTPKGEHAIGVTRCGNHLELLTIQLYLLFCMQGKHFGRLRV